VEIRISAEIQSKNLTAAEKKTLTFDFFGSGCLQVILSVSPHPDYPLKETSSVIANKI
jgi:hypothetical protein